MQKNSKKIFEDYFIKTILQSTFISGEEKITVLEKCIELLDNNIIANAYLNVWKKTLDTVFDYPVHQNLQGRILKECISRYHSEKRGETAYDNTYIPKLKDAKLELVNWNKKDYEIYKEVYIGLELGKVISLVKVKETLIEVTNNWDESSVVNYYQQPLNWITNKLEVKEYPIIEQSATIKVNIISSHFICILEELHNKRFIELPINEKTGEINKLKSSEILLKIFSIFSNSGAVVNDPKLLSDNFLKKDRSSTVVNQIEKSINEISKVVSHVKLKPIKKVY